MPSQFLSTLSLRRATLPRNADCNYRSISIHALLAESDLSTLIIGFSARVFLSTLSLRRATNINSSVNTADKISIHALLAESDAPPAPQGESSKNFYPRSPCGERRKPNKLAGLKLVFLSTLSLRRATSCGPYLSSLTRNFYPRSPCGERHNINSSVNTADKISIHALLAESDVWADTSYNLLDIISIHALLAESDGQGILIWVDKTQFLSTLSLRRATNMEMRVICTSINFYPRSPCGERRESQQPCARPTTDFYPRSPCGERQPTQRAG